MRSLETRQEVVSAREERLRDANSSVIFGRRCGRGQGQEPFNAIARNLGRTAEPKTPEFVRMQVPEHYYQALMHWFRVRAQPAGAHSREWLFECE